MTATAAATAMAVKTAAAVTPRSTTARRNLSIILGVILAAFMATAIMVVAPQQAEAKALKATGGYAFTSSQAAGASENCATVTPQSKKLVIKGSGYYYKGSTLKSLSYGKYTVKLNGKTKYYNTTTKITKKAAFAKLKGGNYIAVHLDVKNGVVKKLTFGV